MARAVDLTGNTAMIERALTVDNTAPLVTLDATGFFVDGSTWWTASAAPVLTGTITDAAPASIKAVIAGGLEVAGAISGPIWTIALPPGALDAGEAPVQIVALDAAGNQSSVVQWVRPDVEPPALHFQASTVNDEGDDWVTFAADHSPEHAHIGIPVDLSGSCTDNVGGINTPNLTVQQSGIFEFPPSSWHCHIRNNSPVTAMVRTSVISLTSTP